MDVVVEAVGTGDEPLEKGCKATPHQEIGVTLGNTDRGRAKRGTLAKPATKPQPDGQRMAKKKTRKRDPNKTTRNRMVKAIKEERRKLLPQVFIDTGFDDEASLNATIGSKHDEFFDLKHDLVPSHETFATQWMKGLKEEAKKTDGSCRQMWEYFNTSDSFKKYLLLFLKGSYLKHYEELSKERPEVADAAIWIGQKNASYGLLVTPRFVGGQWENDKSEIRAFNKPYWTIGHVMKTGLVVPGRNKRFTFSDIDQYLLFFTDTLVRNSGSPYEIQVADHYTDFVKAQANPETVPLLIPEFRYAGLAAKHEHRLDFMIINPYTMDKVGIELSPWSTHGELKKIGNLSQKKINEMAKANFEKEMRKLRKYFKEHNVTCLIYTDDMLKDSKKLFDNEIVPLLIPEDSLIKIDFQMMEFL
jgi:hypothetical protein